MKDILNHLFSNKSFSESESELILTDLAGDKYNISQISAFLSVYALRGITVAELKGFRKAMLNLCLTVNLDEYNAIDVCGTGGDGKNTFNISTLTSFVLAGAGYQVTKHGNYGISSISGSSNILEFFGFRFTNQRDYLRESLDKIGICFLHAPLFHPAMKSLGYIRKDLGVKTFFNMLGPLVNPSQPKTQMIGVFNLELARLYHHLLQESETNYLILHSLDGYDEVSLTDDARYYRNSGEGIIGFQTFVPYALKPVDLQGGKTMEESAKIFYSILDGKGTEAQNSVVLANSILAIGCLDSDKTMEEIREVAYDSLIQKKALNKFKLLLEVNRKQSIKNAS